MLTNEIREKFLKFFEERRHARIPSAPLVPENDPTVLFTTAGMHPLVPFLLGEKHPAGRRLVNYQKCIRTGDIDEVGDATHLTFFEMLGNWSLGDYFKKEAIEWSFEFLTRELEIDPKRIFVTVFEGDQDVPMDDESVGLWIERFKSAEIEAEVGDKETGVVGNARIFPYGRDKNWWGPAGETGPCGPDTEMFYESDREHNPIYGEVCHPNCDCGKYVEIWNDVFMEFNRTAEGKFEPLEQKNVDTGMGLERTAAVLQGADNVFDSDLLGKIKTKVAESTGHNSGLSHEHMHSVRVVVDHLRAAVFILGDGVLPSNLGQGYVLRRLIRRAVRHGKLLGKEDNFTRPIGKTVIEVMGDIYSELAAKQGEILAELEREETRFRVTLENGLKELEKLARDRDHLTGEEIFVLFDTYGLPPELTIEVVRDKNLKLADEWEHKFNEKMEEQKMRSQTATTGVFKGGLADQSEKTTAYHTLAHLTYAALRKVLGEHVHQRGSNITAERMRFDFSHAEKMTDEQKKAVEDYVNEAIEVKSDVSFEELPTAEALQIGALGEFGHKYGDKVKVYTVKDDSGKVWSFEICGGPHVTNTEQIKGTYRIAKEESVAAGIRRVKAVVE